jgi:type II secretory pathway pseudopilin PulG
MSASHRRAGFTLVELLVVTGLMAALLGLVVAGMRPTAASKVREAVGSFRPAVIKTQSAALSNSDGAALIIKAESGTAAAGLSFADQHPPIAATLTSGSFDALFTVPVSGTAFITVSQPLNASDALDGYRIRFGAGATFGQWFRFLPTGVNTAFETFAEVNLEDSRQQTQVNTVMPSSSASLPCQIFRFPEETTAAPNFPSKMAAIDLRYSGIGDDPHPRNAPRTLATLENLGNIGLLFSRSGALESVFPIPPRGSRWTVPASQPTNPLYLLVATRDDITAGTCLQTNNSMWIAIFPNTGNVLTANNVPQPSLPPALASYSDWDVYARDYRAYFQSARANVRPRGFTGAYR